MKKRAPLEETSWPFILVAPLLLLMIVVLYWIPTKVVGFLKSLYERLI